MLIVTLFIQAVIPVSKCCEVTSRQCSLKRILFKLQYQYPLTVKHLPINVHCNALYSSCNTSVHLLWSIFPLMFTVTHFIQIEWERITLRFCKIASVLACVRACVLACVCIDDTRQQGWYSYYFVTYFASINTARRSYQIYSVSNQYQPTWGSSFSFCLRSCFAKVTTSRLHLGYSS
jgi:hypothetical protein